MVTTYGIDRFFQLAFKNPVAEIIFVKLHQLIYLIFNFKWNFHELSVDVNDVEFTMIVIL